MVTDLAIGVSFIRRRSGAILIKGILHLWSVTYSDRQRFIKFPRRQQIKNIRPKNDFRHLLIGITAKLFFTFKSVPDSKCPATINSPFSWKSCTSLSERSVTIHTLSVKNYTKQSVKYEITSIPMTEST